ncbi:hypothetical protein H1C71_001276 [Ictidomys tridecemlineatus]|nr:hypothetical protein H1C71_001276 [Ictidomys tridecemlineatus]
MAISLGPRGSAGILFISHHYPLLSRAAAFCSSAGDYYPESAICQSLGQDGGRPSRIISFVRRQFNGLWLSSDSSPPQKRCSYKELMMSFCGSTPLHLYHQFSPGSVTLNAGAARNKQHALGKLWPEQAPTVYAQQCRPACKSLEKLVCSRWKGLFNSPFAHKGKRFFLQEAAWRGLALPVVLLSLPTLDRVLIHLLIIAFKAQAHGTPHAFCFFGGLETLAVNSRLAGGEGKYSFLLPSEGTLVPRSLPTSSAQHTVANSPRCSGSALTAPPCGSEGTVAAGFLGDPLQGKKRNQNPLEGI